MTKGKFPIQAFLKDERPNSLKRMGKKRIQNQGAELLVEIERSRLIEHQDEHILRSDQKVASWLGTDQCTRHWND